MDPLLTQKRKSTNLAMSANYAKHWSTNDALREILQNTIDGALEYAQHDDSGITRENIRPLRLFRNQDHWRIKATKSQNLYRNSRYEYLNRHGQAVTLESEDIQTYVGCLILVASRDKDKDDNEKKNMLRLLGASWKKNWTKLSEAIAFIQVIYAVNKSEWDPQRVHFGKIQGSILVSLVAENRSRVFCMDDLLCIGATTKHNNTELAGTHGEGMKVGSNRLVVHGYRVQVEGNNERYEFKHRGKPRSTLRAVPKQKKQSTPQNIVSVTVHKVDKRPFHYKDSLDHFTFQILAPGVQSRSDGEILVGEASRGLTYSLGIRISEKCPNMLFGYSFRKIKVGRDRNAIRYEVLTQEIRRLWSLCPDDDGQFMLLLKRLRDKAQPGSFLEYQAMNPTLSTKIAMSFHQMEGENAFPCCDCEKDEVLELLPHKKPVVLHNVIVDLLRKSGSYRKVQEEFLTFYSQDNPTKISFDVDDRARNVIAHAIHLLNGVENGTSFSKEEIFFIDGSKITTQRKKHVCKLIDNLYFIQDNFLESILIDNAEKAAFQLGYHIATKFKGSDDFHFKYIEVAQRKIMERSISVEDILGADKQLRMIISISKTLLKDSSTNRHIFRISISQTGQLVGRWPVTGPKFLIPGTMNRNTFYHIEILDLNTNSLVHDNITGGLLQCEFKTRGFLLMERNAAATILQKKARACIAHQKYKTQRIGFTYLQSLQRGRLALRKLISRQLWMKLLLMRRGFIKLQLVIRQRITHSQRQMHLSDNNINISSNGLGDDDISNAHATSDSDSTRDDDINEDDNGDEWLDELFSQDHNRREFFSPSGSVAGILYDNSLEEDEDSDDESYLAQAQSSSNDTAGLISKRRRLTPPNEVDEVLVAGRTFHRGSWYYNSTRDMHIQILQFDGNKRVSRAICKTIMPFDETFAGSKRCPNRYVSTERDEPIKWLAFFQSVERLDVPEIEFAYTERPRKSSFKDCDLICSYHRLGMSVPVLPSSLEAPTMLDLFAGVGGVSTGFESAGFAIHALVENDGFAAASLKQCHPRATIFPEDINIFEDNVRKGDQGYPRNICHLHSSCPCQWCSRANRNKEVSTRDLENRALSDSHLKMVIACNPYTATFENVPGMLIKGKEKLQGMMRALMDFGHHVSLAVHTASHYGDPQKRKRLFVYSSRLAPPELPKHTHSDDTALTVNDALSDLESIPPKTGCGVVCVNGKVIFNHVPFTQSQNQRDFEKLDGSQPAPTVTTSRKFLHPNLDRTLTLREYARLQSFPDDKQFFGPTTKIRTQIGNAVPLGLSTAVGKAVMTLYKDNRCN